MSYGAKNQPRRDSNPHFQRQRLALYPLSYKAIGDPGRIRTRYLRLRRPALYPMSYEVKLGWLTGFEPAISRFTVSRLNRQATATIKQPRRDLTPHFQRRKLALYPLSYRAKMTI